MEDGKGGLEILAILVKGASMDPKSPRGTKPGLSLADVTTQLAWAAKLDGDPIGADMALALGTQDWRLRDKIEGHLEQYVFAEAAKDGVQADWGKVFAAVVDAFEDEMKGKPTGPGGSRYYRWARAEFRGRAENVGRIFKRLLYREVA